MFDNFLFESCCSNFVHPGYKVSISTRKGKVPVWLTLVMESRKKSQRKSLYLKSHIFFTIKRLSLDKSDKYIDSDLFFAFLYVRNFVASYWVDCPLRYVNARFHLTKYLCIKICFKIGEECCFHSWLLRGKLEREKNLSEIDIRYTDKTRLC